MARDPVGRSGGMLVFWKDQVQVIIHHCDEFSFELEVSSVVGKDNFRITFVYASTDTRVRNDQWESLIQRQQQWGEQWIIGGDFNDILAHEEKRGGRQRLESSFGDFRHFVGAMGMGDIKFRGESWTWANN